MNITHKRASGTFVGGASTVRLWCGILITAFWIAGCSEGSGGGSAASNLNNNSQEDDSESSQLVTLELAMPAGEVYPGDTVQLEVTGVYADGSSKDEIDAVTWSTSNAAVAVVQLGGLLEAVEPGDVAIHASRDSVSSPVLTVTVLEEVTDTDNDSDPPPDDSEDPDDSGYQISLREAANDIAYEDLDGQFVSGNVYIALDPTVGVDGVTFYLDDSDMSGDPFQVENNAPFDFNGGSSSEPNSWNTSTWPDGPHEITAQVELMSGAEVTVTASFTIHNNAPALVLSKTSLTHRYTIDEPGSDESTVTLSITDGSSGSFTLDVEDVSWMTVSEDGDTLPATLTVSVDSDGLEAGSHRASVVASVEDYADVELTVTVLVSSGADGMASSVSRHGITWDFDDEYDVGQYANGDWYVVGPVTIDSVTPGWDGKHHGAMINPVWAKKHGYDDRPGMPSYDSSLRVSFPAELFGGDSLMSVRSWKNDDEGHPTLYTIPGKTDKIPLPAFRDAAVLTVVSEAPPEGSFRPAYGGTDKTLYNVSDLQADLLPSLDKLDGTPDIEDLTDQFDRVWMDHGWKWMTSIFNATNNSPSYGRSIAARYNSGTLALMLDFTDDEKEILLLYLVQIGIDYYGQLQAGAEWGTSGGGLGSGRKWPVLFAGVMLDDADIKNAYIDTYGPETSQEDCQTYYDESNFPSWHSTHCYAPDSAPSSYQFCCTANSWVGAVLCVHILTGETDVDVKELWNHDALFDYQDWFMGEREPGDWQRSWSKFAGSMWDEYRELYGPVWSE